MNSTNISRISAILAFLVCAANFWGNSIYALYTNFDLGWLIRTGQYILGTGSFPGRIPFTWTCPESVCLSYQWLFEILAATLFKCGSLWLVGLAAALTSGLLIFITLPLSWYKKKIPPAIPFACLAFVQTPHWFSARPQLVSYFLLFALIAVLERYRADPKTKLIYSLPFIFCIWANVHMFWMLGLFVLATYVLCNLWRKREIDMPLLPVAAVSFLSLAINPYGLRLFSYAWTFLNGSQYVHITELLPGFSLGTIWIVGFLVLCWIVIAKNRTAVPLEGIIIFAFFTVLTLAMRRFEPIAVIGGWTFIGDALANIDWSKRRLNYSPLTRARIALYTVLVSGLSAVLWMSNYPTNEIAWLSYTQNDRALFELVQTHRLPGGKIFQDPPTGSWLLAMGAESVFIDTRFDAYPKKFVDDAISCLEKGNPAILKQFGINEVLTRDDVGLGYVMLFSPEWQLVLHDGTYGWWVRNSAQLQNALTEWKMSDQLIRQAGLPGKILDTTMESRCVKYLILSRAYLKLDNIELARQAASSGLALIPESKALRQQLHLCEQEKRK